MARQEHRAGTTATLELSFYRNQALFDPASIASVIIYDAAQKALQDPDEHQKEKFRKLGISIMKQSAAKNAYLQKG